MFKSDKDYFNSVSMSIFQIGELSLGLSDEFKEETNEQVLWSAVRGMRNYFAHGYASMDKDIIWGTATENIPELLNLCQRVLNEA